MFCCARPVIIIFALYSFWVPQIAYSAYTGARKALDMQYVVGISLSRLFFPLYMFGCPNNLYSLITERSTISATACWVLVLWMGFQTAVVLLQVAFTSHISCD
jgi:transmembrane E3 ubiquitin-protein ligase